MSYGVPGTGNIRKGRVRIHTKLSSKLGRYNI